MFDLKSFVLCFIHLYEFITLSYKRKIEVLYRDVLNIIFSPALLRVLIVLDDLIDS